MTRFINVCSFHDWLRFLLYLARYIYMEQDNLNLKSNSERDNPFLIWTLQLLTLPHLSILPSPTKSTLTELQSRAFHCPQGVTAHSSLATGLGRVAQALSSATEPSSSRQLTYLIRVPFPQVAEHWVLEWKDTDMSFEMAAWCFPLSPVSYQLSALFLESRQRIVVSSERLPTFLPVCFLLESKTQIATGFWAHCVCFSLVPGPIGQGDKMIIHSPRCERRKHLPSRQHAFIDVQSWEESVLYQET